MEAAIVSSNEFNLKLLHACRKDKQQGNIFYSPISISTALMMLYRGANGITKKEIENVLCIKGREDIHEGFHAILSPLHKLPGNVVLNIANILAVDKNYKILEEYATALKENYYADFKEFDFRKEAETAWKKLNQIIENLTNGKIKDLFTGSTETDVKLVLANAIYFKGMWNVMFDQHATQKKPFYTITGQTSMVDMMYRKGDYKFFNSNELKANFLEIPYLGNQLAMIVILPNAKDGLTFLEANITVEKINYSLRMMHQIELQLSLPRFKLEESVPLKEYLLAMGMKNAFTPNADLSGISGRRNLFVSEARHKSFIEVNEEGTEASAASGIKVVCLSARYPVLFTVDHPFMFFIYEVDSGLILFTGSVHSL